MAVNDPWLISVGPLLTLPADSDNRELEAAGWRRLKGEPLFALLPAVWPRAHVGWVPQPLSPTITPKHLILGDDGTFDSRRTRAGTPRPRSAEDDVALYESLYSFCADAEVVSPPITVLNRAYVLRSPDRRTIDEVLTEFVDAAGGWSATSDTVAREGRLRLSGGELS